MEQLAEFLERIGLELGEVGIHGRVGFGRKRHIIKGEGGARGGTRAEQ